MRKVVTFLFVAALSLILVPHSFASSEASKVKKGLSVTVLGSGGPAMGPAERASAGYLISTDGKPRILMDAGGGTYQRLAESGINIKDLDIVLISHLHIDHMGDIAPIVKAIYFHNRTAGATRDNPIRFYGPNSSAGAFDPTADFIDGHFHTVEGLERYLHGFVPAISAGTFAFEGHNVDYESSTVQTLFTEPDGLTVEAIGVPHGPVPSLAFKVTYKGKSLVYSGDTSSDSPTDNMITIAQGADFLIYDTAVMSDSPPPFINLHTTPERIGEVAVAANAKRLVLSHLTGMTAGKLGKVKRLIRKQGYAGKISVAKDLKVYRVK